MVEVGEPVGERRRARQEGGADAEGLGAEAEVEARRLDLAGREGRGRR